MAVQSAKKSEVEFLFENGKTTVVLLLDSVNKAELIKKIGKAELDKRIQFTRKYVRAYIETAQKLGFSLPAGLLVIHVETEESQGKHVKNPKIALGCFDSKSNRIHLNMSFQYKYSQSMIEVAGAEKVFEYRKELTMPVVVCHELTHWLFSRAQNWVAGCPTEKEYQELLKMHDKYEHRQPRTTEEKREYAVYQSKMEDYRRKLARLILFEGTNQIITARIGMQTIPGSVKCDRNELEDMMDAPYPGEQGIASLMLMAVGEYTLNEAFTKGDFSILERAFCKRYGISASEFYALFESSDKVLQFMAQREGIGRVDAYVNSASFHGVVHDFELSFWKDLAESGKEVSAWQDEDARRVLQGVRERVSGSPEPFAVLNEDDDNVRNLAVWLSRRMGVPENDWITQEAVRQYLRHMIANKKDLPSSDYALLAPYEGEMRRIAKEYGLHYFWGR